MHVQGKKEDNVPEMIHMHVQGKRAATPTHPVD